MSKRLSGGDGEPGPNDPWQAPRSARRSGLVILSGSELRPSLQLMPALALDAARGFRPRRQPFSGYRTVAILAEPIATVGHSLQSTFDLKLVARKDLHEQVGRIAALD